MNKATWKNGQYNHHYFMVKGKSLATVNYSSIRGEGIKASVHYPLPFAKAGFESLDIAKAYAVELIKKQLAYLTEAVS